MRLFRFGFKISLIFIITLIVNVFYSNNAQTWGFASHRKIAEMAVYALPQDMIGFYKLNIKYITEKSVRPDRRSYAVKGEKPRHFINIDHFSNRPFDIFPLTYKAAIEKYTEDTIKRYGVNPWTIAMYYKSLTDAFKAKNYDKILFYSTDISHYIADATVPLHNTQYYNGKTKAQKGIHSLWETRIPELMMKSFDIKAHNAVYIKNINQRIWKLTKESYMAVDSIYMVIEKMYHTFPNDKKYVTNRRGEANTKMYSAEYSRELEMKLNNMVERKMMIAINNVADFWYSAWVEAGQPRLQ